MPRDGGDQLSRGQGLLKGAGPGHLIQARSNAKSFKTEILLSLVQVQVILKANDHKISNHGMEAARGEDGLLPHAAYSLMAASLPLLPAPPGYPLQHPSIVSTDGARLPASSRKRASPR